MTFVYVQKKKRAPAVEWAKGLRKRNRHGIRWKSLTAIFHKKNFMRRPLFLPFFQSKCYSTTRRIPFACKISQVLLHSSSLAVMLFITLRASKHNNFFFFFFRRNTTASNVKKIFLIWILFSLYDSTHLILFALLQYQQKIICHLLVSFIERVILCWVVFIFIFYSWHFVVNFSIE